ncbi:MAG: fatty acid desaturase family protein, partial [Mycobacteriales bacterium]
STERLGFHSTGHRQSLPSAPEVGEELMQRHVDGRVRPWPRDTAPPLVDPRYGGTSGDTRWVRYAGHLSPEEFWKRYAERPNRRPGPLPATAIHEPEGATSAIIICGRRQVSPRGPHQRLYELSQQVRAAGLLRRRYGYYWTRILGTVAAFVAIWVGVVLLGDSWWQLLLVAALALVSTQFGFLGHDTAHRQVFASPTWNAWTSRVLSGLFAGLSYGWWMGKHNGHHNSPNQEDKDPDIGPGVLAFTPAHAATRTGLAARLARYQGWAFFPLLTLEGLGLHIDGIQTLLQQRSIAHRRLELSFIAIRLGGFLAAVFLLLPPAKAAAFIAVQLALFGLLLGGSFAPNHKGMPLVPASMKVDFLRRQVLMSRNIRGGRLIDFMMGGLNYQIEHHLFPSMPRPNLRRAQAIIRAYCHEQGISYREDSLLASYAQTLSHLADVGSAAHSPARS